MEKLWSQSIHSAAHCPASLCCSSKLAVRNKLKFCLRGSWIVCMFLLVAVLAPLLICFKLQGGVLADSTSWAVTFIPIW